MEIRDRVKEQIAKLSYQYASLIDDKDIDNRWESLILRGKNEIWLDCADQILSIKIDDRYELTIKDRKAELPDIPEPKHRDDLAEECNILNQYICDMLKANYVKEV